MGGDYFDSAIEISQVAQIACLLEVSSPKPGNVSSEHDFSDMKYEDFLFSSAAIGEIFLDLEQSSTGDLILAGVKSTKKYVQANTNLGTIILLAPLAKAYYNSINIKGESRLDSFKEELSTVLDNLTVTDAKKAYQAIRLANAGGLGESEQEDVREEPKVDLKEAMELARNRDNIAKEYSNNFEITFNLAYPALKEHFNQADSFREAILQTFLYLLSKLPDTLIARKTSPKKAEAISKKAGMVLKAGGVYTSEGQKRIAQLKKDLSGNNNRYNPGTTADIIAATVFVFILLEGVQVFK